MQGEIIMLLIHSEINQVVLSATISWWWSAR